MTQFAHCLNLTLLACAVALLATVALASPPIEREWPPATIEKLDPTPRPVKWVEPTPEQLPSEEQLDTITVKGKQFKITRVNAAADDHGYQRYLVAQGRAAKDSKGAEAFAAYEKTNEALSFVGSGLAGVNSKERLIIEDCTFIIDFQEGNFGKFTPRRSAIYVEGYKEVIVRNCVFISKSAPTDPLRKTTASIYAADCLKVLVENCYFAGRTIGWRGHVNVWGCGPTTIRNIEIDGQGRSAGGIWVATGVGEGKIGFPHDNNDPKLTIYPAGPLLVENCLIHNQKGKENSDGIYVQSIRPYLIRNCKVESWGEDSLIDVGFRDTSKKWGERFLPNHGGLGMVENCEFANGWVKDSVGMGGGLIFRNNLLKNAWFFPYAFDGGNWYVISNRFDAMSRVIVSGKNGQLNGWTPGEGMFAKGGKMMLFNNEFIAGKNVAAMYVAGSKQAPITEVISADYNVFSGKDDTTWAIEHDGTKMSLAQWREKTGNDKHTLTGETSVASFADVDAGLVKLPGGVEMKFGPFKAGLTGPVGVTTPGLVDKAQKFSDAADAEYRQNNFTVEAEENGAESTMTGRVEKRPWASGGGYMILEVQPGQVHSFKGTVEKANKYMVWSKVVNKSNAGQYQLLVDGQPVGGVKDFKSDKPTAIMHSEVELTAGEHTFALKAIEPSEGGGKMFLEFDGLVLRDAESVVEDSARAKASAARAAAEKAAKARIEARKIKHDLSEIAIAKPSAGHAAVYGADKNRYLLWMPKEAGDELGIDIEVPEAGTYDVAVATTAQQDTGKMALRVDEDEPGQEVPIGGTMHLGESKLSAGKHRLTFIYLEGKPEIKIRMKRLELVPTDDEQ